MIRKKDLRKQLVHVMEHVDGLESEFNTRPVTHEKIQHISYTVKDNEEVVKYGHGPCGAYQTIKVYEPSIETKVNAILEHLGLDVSHKAPRLTELRTPAELVVKKKAIKAKKATNKRKR